MKVIERFWNLIYYFAYLGDYRIHLMFNKINPVLYIYKFPFAKRHFTKKGIDPVLELNKAFKRPDFGFSNMLVGGLMYGLVFIFQIGIIEIFLGFTRLKPQGIFFIVIPPFIISIVINNMLLFKNDKYLKYFQEFKLMDKFLKKKWSWISFGVIVGIFMFLIIGFIFMDYRI
jgi:hypothetical protein